MIKIKSNINIDILFDLICPWCFIGIKRLEIAIKSRPFLNFNKCWYPYLLNPEIPISGTDRNNYLITKFGSQERVEILHRKMAHEGKSLNIKFAFNAIKKTPNTVDSHRLIHIVQQDKDPSKLVEKLFLAFLSEGKDIGKKEILLEIANGLNLDFKHLDYYLTTNLGKSIITKENLRARELGISGIPVFIINKQFVISGAQHTEAFVRIFDAAHVLSQTTKKS